MQVPTTMFSLHCPTPDAWLEQSLYNLPILLSDHAHCERKAAQAALSFMPWFVNDPGISTQLAKLAREEIRHYEQVIHHMKKMGIEHKNRAPCRYAKSLHSYTSKDGIDAIVDKLLVASIIEARSCERFRALGAVLEPPLRDFYHKLYLAEARHARVYVDYAQSFMKESLVLERLELLLSFEANIIQQPESCFRFHSGVPGNNKVVKNDTA